MHANLTSRYHSDIYPEYEVEGKHQILEASITAAERHFVELSVEINSKQRNTM